MTITEWAEANRVLPDEETEGQWRTSRIPYLRDILDKAYPFDPDAVVIFKKASAVGATEIMLFQARLYFGIEET